MPSFTSGIGDPVVRVESNTGDRHWLNVHTDKSKMSTVTGSHKNEWQDETSLTRSTFTVDSQQS